MQIALYLINCSNNERSKHTKGHLNKNEGYFYSEIVLKQLYLDKFSFYCLLFVESATINNDNISTDKTVKKNTS